MGAEWYRDCFDASYIELDRLRYPPALNEAQAQGIARLLGMRRRGRWLDACCGYGRHLIPLLRRGFDVTGVDLSGPMLRALEEDARQRGLSAPLLQRDIRALPFARHFDGAYLAGSSFGVFEDPRDDLSALQSIHRSLKPGGRLLLDQANPEATLPASTPCRNQYRLGSQQVEEEVTRDDDARRMVIRRTLRRGSWTKQWTMSFRIYDADDLLRVVRQAGFAGAVLYGDLESGPYAESSPRLVLVARASFAGDSSPVHS